MARDTTDRPATDAGEAARRKELRTNWLLNLPALVWLTLFAAGYATARNPQHLYRPAG